VSGVDSLAVRVPSSANFTTDVQELVREVNYGNGMSRVRRSAHYQGVADLRPLGIDAILHAYCKRTDPHQHKLELLDTGKKSYSELARQIQSVFQIDPSNLGIMRLDLCADVPGIPVLWFQPRVRIKYKRFAGEIGKLQYERLGSGRIETLIVGKRPNVFRFYDKVAESQMQFRKMRRKASPDSEPLDFEAEFGFSEVTTLTRVERQYGGQRIPPLVDTFGKLANAPDLNPFEPLEIVSGGGGTVPNVEECSGPTEWMTGMKMREMIASMGFQQYRGWLNRHSNGNAARIVERYRRFLPHDDARVITTDVLYDIYRDSVTNQLSQ
jgi:hypothetical protein